MRSLALASAAALSLVVGACSEPKPQELPPAGLAGAPGAHGAPGGHGGAPGAPGAPGGGLIPISPDAQMPPGHPPIEGTAQDGQPKMALPNFGGGNPADAPMPPTPGMGSGGENVVVSGLVQEVLEVPEYTYMRLQVTGGSDVWVAVNKTPMSVGKKVTVNQSLVMENFFSKGLNRTFPTLIMGTMVGAPS